MKVLFLGYVWPEIRSSAAGVRDAQLIRLFRQLGWQVEYASQAKAGPFSDELENAGVRTHSVPLNDSRFEEILIGIAPDAVVFDRFVIEEQFGWRVKEALPQCLRILDTQDLHFLRRSREDVFKVGTPWTELGPTFRGPWRTEDVHRELAAIYRSDVALVISLHEKALLTGVFGVPESRLLELGYAYPEEDLSTAGAPGPSWQERAGVVWIGNFRHAPNADAVKWLRRELWPAVRALDPALEIRVYGAYPAREHMEMTSRELGFVVEGPAVEASEVLSRARVNAACLRFGAGLKGKIVEGWRVGTPAVATPVAAEGLGWDGETSLTWGGCVAGSEREWVQSVVSLAGDSGRWEAASRVGRAIVRDQFSESRAVGALGGWLEHVVPDLVRFRAANWVGGILWQEAFAAKKYLSRWIELKNQLANPPKTE